MMICVLNYREGSVHFHKLPNNISDIECYLYTKFNYPIGDITWMEILK